MSERFRELIRKVGSGRHTSQVLTRAEAAEALQLMLSATATPAQIGAFLIAHRIRRPTGTELAGFLDTYANWLPSVLAPSTTRPPVVLGYPYDGRDRTAPLGPLLALLLAAAGQPVVLHGSDRVATKYGVPLIELWEAIGVNWRSRSIPELNRCLEQAGLAQLHQPSLCPAAEVLNGYRSELGKRPPLATAELMIVPVQGAALPICGFVHPPTELMIQEALELRGITRFFTIKGLEGSPELPRDRAAIVGRWQAGNCDRQILHARDWDLGDSELPWMGEAAWTEAAQAMLMGQPSVLEPLLRWNGAVYLWLLGLAESVPAGLAQVDQLLKAGALQQQRDRLQQLLEPVPDLTLS
ncbi:anthranilate phosphoribosyltransferase family protein [Synechococcus elongatus IITB7]|uniref:anthranilate phosphoribosyltransferase family protein n=1 Tax=Synechococcus elongatus TaxID=32046 RepID=UPI0030CC0359